MNILKAATLDGYRRLKDRSLALRFITDLEVTSDEVRDVDSLVGRAGFIYFKPENALTEKELEELEKTELHHEGKTKSQRLRAVLYCIYQKEKPQVDFDVWYGGQMEKIIEHFKGKLDETT